MNTDIEKKERKRFIVLDTDNYVIRDCTAGINYHLQGKGEAAGLAAEFNACYTYNSELQEKCKAAEEENAKLRNIISELNNEVARLDKSES